MGDLIVPPGTRFQITKHLNLEYLAQRTTFFCRCFEFEALKVEMALQCMGTDPIVPPGPRFQITKYLYLAILAKGANFFCGSFEFEVLKVELVS
jgi:hypothetical protein